MKKKTKHTNKYRRNAAPAPRPAAPRAPRATTKQPDETPLRRLGYTAAGAAATSLVGSFLAREGWAPKTVATALGAVGAAIAWKGDGSTIRSVGAGAMSAAGSQLALMVIDDHEKKTETAPAPVKKRDAGEVPPGALEGAFERARLRLSYDAEA